MESAPGFISSDAAIIRFGRRSSDKQSSRPKMEDTDVFSVVFDYGMQKIVFHRL